MAKSIFIPGVTPLSRLTKAVDGRIGALNCDIYDHDVYVLSEIEGMIRFAAAGGLLNKAEKAKFVESVNVKLKAWAELHDEDAGNYRLSL